MEGESFTALSVPTIALDDYFDVSDKVTLLKIDVEGAEFGVFKGAERILRSFSSAKTGISRLAMCRTYFPILRASAMKEASFAAIRFCRSPGSMPPFISARTENGSGRARTTATISSFAKRAGRVILHIEWKCVVIGDFRVWHEPDHLRFP
jgi:hypothetical protein